MTESANLKSLDFSIDDASDYIKWITRGFNEGGMTAYMVHLLFDKHIYATPVGVIKKALLDWWYGTMKSTSSSQNAIMRLSTFQLCQARDLSEFLTHILKVNYT